MSSKARKEHLELLPSVGIKRDPVTGKFILQPLPQLLTSVSINPRESAKKNYSTDKRKKLASQLKPLVLPASLNVEESARPHKFRKLEISPEPPPIQLSSRVSRNSFSRRSLVPTRQTNTANMRRTFITRRNVDDKSPLLNLEEVEETLLKTKSSLRGYPFRSPKEVPTKFDFRNNMSKPNGIPSRNSKMPKLEKQFKINRSIKKANSPLMMSRISEENSDSSKISIDNATNENDSKNVFVTNSLTGILKNIIESQENAFKEMTEIFEKNKQIHRENMCSLTKVLESIENLKNHEVTGQDNFICKETTAPKQNNENLRISVLKKNVEKNKEEIDSPRIKNALDLYNLTRISCPILETPKCQKQADRKYTKSAGKELSDTIFNQCMLLQGTPRLK